METSRKIDCEDDEEDDEEYWLDPEVEFMVSQMDPQSYTNYLQFTEGYSDDCEHEDMNNEMKLKMSDAEFLELFALPLEDCCNDLASLKLSTYSLKTYNAHHHGRAEQVVRVQTK